jgi:7,8-dihydropterin-6-yl-methyl-4-(beta-D-ribofuranosyl)aminobenzene 5'-phosphate synthase
MIARLLILTMLVPFHNHQGKNDMPKNFSHSKIAITVVYDNVNYNSTLTSEWGFGCVIQTEKDTVLFDTGGNGKVLLNNMEKLNIDPRSIHSVIISHNHYDHQGGLKDFLSVHSKVTVFIPNSSPAGLDQEIQSTGAIAVRVDSFTQINETMFSAGELKGNIPEQSLVVHSSQGLVIITGCAHPGIVRIIEQVKSLFPAEVIYLTIGGFHLKSESIQHIEEIVKTLQEDGVQTIAPSHCTGEAAIRIFKNRFGKNFIESGVGRRIVI